MVERKKGFKSALIFVAKVGLSALALYIVFRKVDLDQLRVILRDSKWLWFLPAVLLIAASKVISANRLNLFFKGIGLQLDAFFNLKLYWLGMYYNLFLPGGIGGDAYKIYLLKKQGHGRVKTLVLATLSDRALGLLALVVLALALGAQMSVGPIHEGWWWLAIPIVILGAWLGLYFIHKGLLKVFWPGLGWSFLVQILQLLSVFILLIMTGTPEPWGGYLFLFLLSSVLTALPISYGGAGAREIAFYFGAAHLGLPEAPAVAISLLFYLGSLVVSLSGMYFSFKHLVPAERGTEVAAH